MLYQNKGWLKESYLQKKLSTRQMGKIADCHNETVRRWLIKFRIDRRPATNINYVGITPLLGEFLDGHLLGDMSILQERTQSAFISFNYKYREYSEWVASLLFDFGVERRGQIKGYRNDFGVSWLYHSRYYRDLVDLRRRWYPEGKKIVPTDLALTPITTRQWFLDDGSFIRVTGNVIGRVQFATNAFTRPEVQVLASKLASSISNNSIQVNKAVTGWTLLFSNQATVRAFFNYIGDCPPELENIYGYKWPIKEQVKKGV